MSIRSACGEISDDDLNSIGYYVSGTYNACKDEITVYTIDPVTYRHELIHKDQAYDNRLYGCNFKLGMFVNEIEAYTLSPLPEWIFYKIYPYELA